MAVTNLTATQIASNWATKMAASVTRIKTGVQAVKTAPGVAAAAAATTWLQNTQAAKTKFKKNVASVSLAAWQTDFITKGLPRIASGATAAEPKVAAFMTAWIPFLQRTVPTLPARGNFTQNLARSAAMIKAAHAFSYTK